MAAAADSAMLIALDMAKNQAQDLDEVTGRDVALPALDAAQTTWRNHRDAQCDYEGALFGGGSGTGIAIQSCRIKLTRAHTEALLARLN
jgi:uncharacterized protein YecT (DUF1311 family)